MTDEFPPVPVNDLVLVLTHLQNDFWHPDGRGYAFTRDTLPHPDTLDRITRVVAACRAHPIASGDAALRRHVSNFSRLGAGR